MFFPQWVIAVLLAGGPQTGTLTDQSGNFTDEKACIEYAIATGPRILDWVRGRNNLTLHTPATIISAICVDKIAPEPVEKIPGITA